jgi:hypothetical protein
VSDGDRERRESLGASSGRQEGHRASTQPPHNKPLDRPPTHPPNQAGSSQRGTHLLHLCHRAAALVNQHAGLVLSQHQAGRGVALSSDAAAADPSSRGVRPKGHAAAAAVHHWRAAGAAPRGMTGPQVVRGQVVGVELRGQPHGHAPRAGAHPKAVHGVHAQGAACHRGGGQLSVEGELGVVTLLQRHQSNGLQGVGQVVGGGIFGMSAPEEEEAAALDLQGITPEQSCIDCRAAATAPNSHSTQQHPP